MKNNEALAHNLVAVYANLEQARDAAQQLRDAGLADERLSLVGREQTAPPAEGDQPTEPADVADEMLKGSAKGTAAGTAAGTVAGAVAGVLAFGIPGVGPVIGAGILATTLGGAAAGATAGWLWGAFDRMWEMTYRDLVKEGRVIVAFHTDDVGEADKARTILRNTGPEKLDELDASGEVVRRDE